MIPGFAETPDPPYYAVIFTSRHTGAAADAYGQTAQRMLELAAARPGYLGVESVHDATGLGITVSYWKDLDSIAGWKADAEHRAAQSRGHREWYSHFELRVAKVERATSKP